MDKEPWEIISDILQSKEWKDYRHKALEEEFEAMSKEELKDNLRNMGIEFDGDWCDIYRYK